jgi:hypothetical protein
MLTNGHLIAVTAGVLATWAATGIQAADAAPDQPSPEEMAAELGVDLPGRPWHLADIWWVFDGPVNAFESLAVDVTIDRDIPSSYNLYIAPVGVAQINGLQFYGGLQSNINGWASKDSRERVHPGKGAIFSRWSHDLKKPIGLDHVRIASDGLCESAGYEGSFCSVRRPYAWTKGTYTYSIIRGDTERVGDQDHTWFHCLVRSHRTGSETYIGSLRFEGTAFTFWERHAAFVEVYATHKIPRAGIPRVVVTFGYPRLNGAAPPLKNASVNYNVSQSPQCAKARAEASSIVVEVGPMFTRDTAEGQQALYPTVPTRPTTEE